MAAHLYSAELIGDSTLSYVTTATGVSHQTVAHRLVQECKAVIISHDNPIERMRKLLEILNDEPSGKTLANRISEEVSIANSQQLCVQAGTCNECVMGLIFFLYKQFLLYIKCKLVKL